MKQDVLIKLQGFKKSLKQSQDSYQQNKGIMDSQLKLLKNAHKLVNIAAAKKKVEIIKNEEEKLLIELESLIAAFTTEYME